MNKTVVICFLNNKGGVGKTTLSLNVTAAFAAKGKSVMFVDMDDSMNATFHLKAKKSKEKAFPISTLLIDSKIELEDCILWDTKIENVGLIASDHNISSTIRSKLMGSKEAQVSMAKRLKDSLEILDGTVDYIIMDVSPSLDTVVSLALMVTTHIVFVSDSNAYSEQGIVNLLKSDEMKFVRKFNPTQKVVGVVYNKVDMRRNVARMLVNREALPSGIPVLPVFIPERNEIDVNSFTQDFAVGEGKKSILSQSFDELADYLIDHMVIDVTQDPELPMAEEA